MLQGKGKHVRFVRISSNADLRDSILGALVKQVT